MWFYIGILLTVASVYYYINRDLMLFRLLFFISMEKGETEIKNLVNSILKFEPTSPKGVIHFCKRLEWLKKKLKGNRKKISTPCLENSLMKIDVKIITLVEQFGENP